MNTPLDALKYVACEGSKALGRLAATIVEDIADRLYPLDGTDIRAGLEQFAAGERVSPSWLFDDEEADSDSWEPQTEAEWLGNDLPTGGNMTTPQRFRRKPVEIEAMQVTRENLGGVAQWASTRGVWSLDAPSLGVFIDSGGWGLTKASLGDWVIRDEKGFHVCRPDDFERTYEQENTL